ncbi:MAG: hypothetical protein RL291_980 [Pseudomonadota bacterium]
MIPMPTAPALLPRLREDLELVRRGQFQAASACLVYDPLRHQFTELDTLGAELLSVMPLVTTVDGMMAEMRARYNRVVEATDVEAFLLLLRQAQLVVPDTTRPWAERWRLLTPPTRSMFSRFVHNYLFFRIPLVAPEEFLARTYPYVRPLFSIAAAWCVAIIGALGLWLAIRQWEQFLAGFADIFSLSGVAAITVSLFLIKAVHELGHAYAAHHAGVRVPAMGIAFMLGVPMFYTDVTDAWRLPDRARRLLIDSAGVLVEIAVAAIALVIWALLEPGVLRTIAFSLATTSLALTLIVNLNPFMRFDGYHMLVDATGESNLQPRSFAFATWGLREVLFKPDDEKPETWSGLRAALYTLYAWATWLYRVVLFVGIAVLVYGFFVKLLGILLFLIEIFVFILKPIAAEMKIWWENRMRYLKTRRTWITLATTGAILTLVIVPWSTRINIPAVAEVADVQRVFAPRPAQVREIVVRPGQHVKAGDVLAVMTARELDAEIKLTEIRAQLIAARLERRTADASDQTESLVLDQEATAIKQKREGLAQEAKLLVVRAPQSGRVLELNPALHPGRHVGRTELIAAIGEPGAWRVRGYATDTEALRLAGVEHASFLVPNGSLFHVEAHALTVAPAGATTIELPMLAIQNGGTVAAELDREQRLKALEARVLVTATLKAAPHDGPQNVRGVLVAQGTGESILGRFLRRAASVLLRETGF